MKQLSAFQKIFWGILCIVSLWYFLIMTSIHPFSDDQAQYLFLDHAICPSFGNVSNGKGLYEIIYPFPFSRFYSAPEQASQSNKDIVVFVDTSRMLTATPGSKYNDRGSRVDQFLVQSYPAYILNQSGSLLIFDAYGYHDLFFYQEALDTNGEWHRIERTIFYGCGNSLGEIEIKPGSFFVSKVPIYKGRYRTRLRLMTEWGPSNSYVGEVNPGQFIQE